jgi:hypothetical protein
MRIIPRRIDVERVKKGKPWRMIYGRRKTGKTFLVENFTDYDNFYFVNRDTTVFDKISGEKYTYSEFVKIFRSMLGQRKVVIDEFHRLPEEFLDFLHATGKSGELTLISSTLWLSKRLIESKSPLLGLVYPVRIGLIDERDILLGLSEGLSGRELIEASVYLRDPFLIPYYKPPVRDFIASFLYEARFMVKELVGEVFSEEERELTNIYEGIMKAIANGKNISTEISTLLFSRGLLSKDNPGVLQKYLEMLTTMGILEKIRVQNRRRFRYYHLSPLIDLHYYLEEKYAYTELETGEEFIKKAVDVKIPFHVEQFLRNLLAKLYGLRHERIEEKDLEVDISLFEFKKLRLVAEVKWKSFVDKAELRKVEEKLERFECKKILIVPDRRDLEGREIEILDIGDIFRLLNQRQIQ